MKKKEKGGKERKKNRRKGNKKMISYEFDVGLYAFIFYKKLRDCNTAW